MSHKAAMSDQPVLRAKQQYADSTVADMRHLCGMTFTINDEQIKEAAKDGEGVVLPLRDIVDNYDKVKQDIQQRIGYLYNLQDHSKLPLNFCLVDCVVDQIASPDNNGGAFMGASLAVPHVHGASFPYENISKCGNYRKVIPLDQVTQYVNGQPHAMMQTLKHHATADQHPLLTRKSAMNLPHVFPSGRVEGSGGVVPDTDAAFLKNAQGGQFMLHAGEVTNDLAFPEKKHLPMVTEVMSADQKMGARAKHLVSMPYGSYNSTWWSKDNDKHYHTEDGVVVPLDEFAHRQFHFIDSKNESRVVDLDKIGLWVNLQLLRGASKINGRINLNGFPIVPRHEEGKQNIPFQNFKKFQKSQLAPAVRPFVRQDEEKRSDAPSSQWQMDTDDERMEPDYACQQQQQQQQGQQQQGQRPHVQMTFRR